MKFSKAQQLVNKTSKEGRKKETKTSKMCKKLGLDSRQTINSGAVFGDADHKIESFMVEEKNSQTLNIRQAFLKLQSQASNKFPVPSICLKHLIDNQEVVTIYWTEFLRLLISDKKEWFINER